MQSWIFITPVFRVTWSLDIFLCVCVCVCVFGNCDTVFTVTFDQFNASLLNKSFNILMLV